MSRIDKLKKNLNNFDGFYISGKANIFYYSGFTSEDAALLVTADRAVIITDSEHVIFSAIQSETIANRLDDSVETEETEEGEE